MGRIKVSAWLCDRCGHIWLSASEPRACAKCKSRSWNKTVGVVAQEPAKPEPLRTWYEPSKASAQANERLFERTFVAPIPKPKDAKR